MTKSLLPTGCYDLLPPQARQESELSAALLSVFEGFGYEQVSPPLLEYSDSLLSGRGASLSPSLFRVMDPAAHKVMALRPDITLQVARIATSRLAHAPRPLRLCYNGLILRMQSGQFHNERQLRQTGIELIGAASADADAEVILVAAEALMRAGITQLSIDLNLPGIVSALLASEKLDNEQAQALLAAVAHKDVSTIKTFSFRHRDTLIALLASAGPADAALAAIAKLNLPDDARRQCRELEAVIGILKTCGSKEWTLTVDATENRGLSYHSGISFSIFVPGVACEVGRGGRYRIETDGADTEATGFTFYVETLRGLLPEAKRGKRVFIEDGITDHKAAALRTEGYITVYALSEYGHDEDEARRLGCGFLYRNGNLETLG